MLMIKGFYEVDEFHNCYTEIMFSSSLKHFYFKKKNQALSRHFKTVAVLFWQYSWGSSCSCWRTDGHFSCPDVAEGNTHEFVKVLWTLQTFTPNSHMFKAAFSCCILIGPCTFVTSSGSGPATGQVEEGRAWLLSCPSPVRWWPGGWSLSNLQ